MKLLLLILVSIILGGCNRLDAHQPLTNSLVKFDRAKTITQTFVSTRENLNTVSVCIRNPARVLAPLRFELWEQDALEPIRTLDFNGGNIDNQDCTKFQFAPVTDSARKPYEFRLISTSQVEDALSRVSMHVEASDDTDYPQGTAYLDGQPLAEDLHFKTHYYQDFSTTFRESCSQFYYRLNNDLFFLIPYLLLLGLILYKLLRLPTK